MIKHIENFEDIQDASKIMYEMVERIKIIDDKKELSALGYESITTAIDLLENVKGTMLYESVVQVLHIAVRFFEIYATTNNEKTIAQYIAIMHKKHLDDYMQQVQKRLLENTEKGGGDYVN